VIRLGLEILDDYLDIFLEQRIEVAHFNCRSNTAGLSNVAAEKARIPVFRYAARINSVFVPNVPLAPLIVRRFTVYLTNSS
jgi:hypothetical protein